MYVQSNNKVQLSKVECMTEFVQWPKFDCAIDLVAIILSTNRLLTVATYVYVLGATR